MQRREEGGKGDDGLVGSVFEVAVGARAGARTTGSYDRSSETGAQRRRVAIGENEKVHSLSEKSSLLWLSLLASHQNRPYVAPNPAKLIQFSGTRTNPTPNNKSSNSLTARSIPALAASKCWTETPSSSPRRATPSPPRTTTSPPKISYPRRKRSSRNRGIRSPSTLPSAPTT